MTLNNPLIGDIHLSLEVGVGVEAVDRFQHRLSLLLEVLMAAQQQNTRNASQRSNHVDTLAVYAVLHGCALAQHVM